MKILFLATLVAFFVPVVASASLPEIPTITLEKARLSGRHCKRRDSRHTEKALRLVIKTRDEFSDFWKQFTASIPPANGIPPPPEIDFAKEMVVISVMGQRPTSGYWTIIDGACEVDGQVEVFISNVENVKCIGALTVLTYPADAVRLPKTDLPVVFRETQVDCKQWYRQFHYLN